MKFYFRKNILIYFKFSVPLYLLVFLPCINLAQNAQSNIIQFSLDDVVTIAKGNSISSLKAITTKENKYWQWRTYLSNYKPQLTLDGILPNFNRANIAVTQPDGSIEFKSVSNDNSQLNLGISQNIGSTGAEIFINSNLIRFRDFDRNQTRFNSNPLTIGFKQPLFAFNSLSWAKKIEPLLYEESQKKFVEDIEEVGRTASTLFFNLLIAQINQDISIKNKSSSDTLYKIGEVRYDLGRLSKDELLQLRLASLNAKKAFAQANLNVESATIKLKSYIGYKNEMPIELLLPEEIVEFSINTEVAIEQAHFNKYQTVGYKRALIESKREVAKAKGDNGLQVNIFGSFGLTNSASDIPGIYKNPRDQQSVQVGFQIPIMDWGRSASRISTAEANKKLIEYTIAQEKLDFDQEILTQVNQFNMIKGQMSDSFEADNTAQERYEISKNRYIIGDISITDLNIALQEKDQARRDYILTLKSFWDAYFNIRVLTLYDFKFGKKIEVNVTN